VLKWVELAIMVHLQIQVLSNVPFEVLLRRPFFKVANYAEVSRQGGNHVIYIKDLKTRVLYMFPDSTPPIQDAKAKISSIDNSTVARTKMSSSLAPEAVPLVAELSSPALLEQDKEPSLLIPSSPDVSVFSFSSTHNSLTDVHWGQGVRSITPFTHFSLFFPFFLALIHTLCHDQL
jgi:hypothetical protein